MRSFHTSSTKSELLMLDIFTHTCRVPTDKEDCHTFRPISKDLNDLRIKEEHLHH